MGKTTRYVIAGVAVLVCLAVAGIYAVRLVLPGLALDPIAGTNNYWRQGEEVYYVPHGNWFELGMSKVQGADVSTISEIGAGYMKDKRAVFYQDQILDGADPETFALVEGDESFGKDRKAVYYRGVKLENLNAATFKIVTPYLVSDGARVLGYNAGLRSFADVPLDPKGYRVVSDNYVVDDRRVFIRGQEIEGADGSSFRMVSPLENAKELYGQDYWLYWVDSSRVYYGTQVVPDAKPSSFRLTSAAKEIAEDGSRCYLRGEPAQEKVCEAAR